MRRLSIVLAVCTSVLILCPTGTAFAQEAAQLPSPGITPDSPFYFLDELAEQITLRFTFREDARAEKALQYAEERLAEMNCMMARNNVRATIRAMNGYIHCIDVAMEAVEASGNQGTSSQAMLALGMAKHTAIFDDVAGEIPEEAREVMTQTRERAHICQQIALRLMEQEDPEMANQVRLMLRKRQRNSVRVMAGEEETTSFQEDSQETTVPSEQDTGEATILDQGYNEERPQLGLENQAQVCDNGRHTVNSRLRQNIMFGEPPGVTPAGK
ncbi:DUF5667 domain-containing protein [Chloroflexota bacterium]